MHENLVCCFLEDLNQIFGFEKTPHGYKFIGINFESKGLVYFQQLQKQAFLFYSQIRFHIGTEKTTNPIVLTSR